MMWCQFFIHSNDKWSTNQWKRARALAQFETFFFLLEFCASNKWNKVRFLCTFINHLQKCICASQHRNNNCFYSQSFIICSSNFYYWIWFSSWVYARLHNVCAREWSVRSISYMWNHFFFCLVMQFSLCVSVLFLVGCCCSGSNQ